MARTILCPSSSQIIFDRSFRIIHLQSFNNFFRPSFHKQRSPTLFTNNGSTKTTLALSHRPRMKRNSNNSNNTMLFLLLILLLSDAVAAFSLQPLTVTMMMTSRRIRRSSSSALSSATLPSSTTTATAGTVSPPPALLSQISPPFDGGSSSSTSSSSSSWTGTTTTSRIQRENNDDDDDNDNKNDNDETFARGLSRLDAITKTEFLGDDSLSGNKANQDTSTASSSTTVIMPTTRTLTRTSRSGNNTRDNDDDINKTLQQQNQQQQSSQSSSLSLPICRVVATSDGQIPATPQSLHCAVSDLLFSPPHYILRKLDDIYHAMSHEETRRLRYMEQRKEHTVTSSLQTISLNGSNDDETSLSSSSTSSTSSSTSSLSFDVKEEQKLVSVVRTCLEDAGFELLSQRDLDLCNALNAGYLLRLSILPDVSQLDPGILQEFYPEYFINDNNDNDGGVSLKNNETDNFLFHGKVLVYWRGYSKEVSRGRLLLPKIDYLQASLVQQSAAWMQDKLTCAEQGIANRLRRVVRSATATSLRTGRTIVNGVNRLVMLRNRPGLRKTLRASLKHLLVLLSSRQRAVLRENHPHHGGTTPGTTTQYMSASTSPTSTFFKLARYGSGSGSSKIRLGDSGPDGSMEDALKPFVICEDFITSNGDNVDDKIDDVNGDGYCPAFLDDNDDDRVGGGGGLDEVMYNCLNHGNLQCRYDRERLQAAMKKNNNMMKNTQQQLPPMQLLERVSIRNIVNVFSRDGRRNLLRTLFSKSELVEPTYQEVVVVWRPLPPRRQGDTITTAANQFVQNVIKKKQPPKWMYEMADMFDIQGLPQIPETPVKKPDPQPLELRTFDDVPMSNIAAVLPKTKLVFRPADAFVFDFVSIVSLVLLISSQRFDSPRLDLLAIVSVSLWFVRLIIRYSNKLARYDLLVKTFLTSKISHRNAGALKYLATEAGSQRATRAGLVYAWLSGRSCSNNAQMQQDDASSSSSLSSSTCMGMNRQELLRDGPMELNDLVYGKQVRVDVDAALNDLEDLNLITTTTVATPAINGSEQQQQQQQQQVVTVVRDADTVVDRLRQAWSRIFEGKLGLNMLIGRRDHGDGGSRTSGTPGL